MATLLQRDLQGYSRTDLLRSATALCQLQACCLEAIPHSPVPGSALALHESSSDRLSDPPQSSHTSSPSSSPSQAQAQRELERIEREQTVLEAGFRDLDPAFLGRCWNLSLAAYGKKALVVQVRRASLSLSLSLSLCVCVCVSPTLSDTYSFTPTLCCLLKIATPIDYND